jgi:hypothetical protein
MHRYEPPLSTTHEARSKHAQRTTQQSRSKRPDPVQVFTPILWTVEKLLKLNRHTITVSLQKSKNVIKHIITSTPSFALKETTVVQDDGTISHGTHAF